MPRNAEQKIKLLVLYDILLRETDEEHALSTDEIVEKLRERGIDIARKVLPCDIALLNKYGFEVLSYKKRSYYYYVAYRKFDVAELRILIDAIQAANFIPEAHTIDLAKRLAGLAGAHSAEEMGRRFVCYDTVKKNNNNIFYYTDKIERAIEDSKKISFRYFSLNYKGEKVFRREGRRYIVNPVVLVCDNDNYYLVCYDDKHEGTANYRLDRMDELAEEDTPITEREKSRDFNQHTYRRQSFSMYAGEPTDACLTVEEPLVEEMFDKFGMNIKLIPLGDGKYRLAVCVQVSLAFFRWVAGSLGKIRIDGPTQVSEEFARFIEQLKSSY